jgi:hypothetical protein
VVVKRNFLLLSFVVSLGFTTIVYAQPGMTRAAQTTNLELLGELTDSLLIDISRAVIPDDYEQGLIKSLNHEHDADWFLESRLLRFLRNIGFDSLYVGDDKPDVSFDSTGSKKLLLWQYKIVDIGIDYTPRRSEGAGNERYNRIARIELFSLITQQPSGKVLWNGMAEKVFEDVLPVNSLEEVENDNLIFTKGQTLQTVDSGNLMKPVFIVAITGVVVYLFYAFRSR